MEMKYDPDIIKQFAIDLYSQARSIVAAWTFLAVLVGIAAAAFAAETIGSIAALFALVFVTAIGYLLGKSRSAHLKLAAQLALCQVQIENNTR